MTREELHRSWRESVADVYGYGYVIEEVIEEAVTHIYYMRSLDK